MTPFDQAQAVYASEPCARTFAEDLYWHLRYGIVLSTPQCFAMVRSVNHDWTPQQLKNPACVSQSGDCWMMWLAAGNISPVFELGEPKEYACYERSNVLRVVKYDAFRRLYRPRPLRTSAHEGIVRVAE